MLTAVFAVISCCSCMAMNFNLGDFSWEPLSNHFSSSIGKLDAVDTPIVSGSRTSTLMCLANTYSDIADVINTSVGTNFSYNLFNISNVFSFGATHLSSYCTANIFYFTQTSKEYRQKFEPNQNFTQSVEELNNGDITPVQFFNSYGVGYVNGLRKGITIFGNISFTLENEEEKNTLSNTLTGSYSNFASIETKIKNDSKCKNMSMQLSLNLTQSGGLSQNLNKAIQIYLTSRSNNTFEQNLENSNSEVKKYSMDGGSIVYIKSKSIKDKGQVIISIVPGKAFSEKTDESFKLVNDILKRVQEYVNSDDFEGVEGITKQIENNIDPICIVPPDATCLEYWHTSTDLGFTQSSKDKLQALFSEIINIISANDDIKVFYDNMNDLNTQNQASQLEYSLLDFLAKYPEAIINEKEFTDVFSEVSDKRDYFINQLENKIDYLPLTMESCSDINEIPKEINKEVEAYKNEHQTAFEKFNALRYTSGFSIKQVVTENKIPGVHLADEKPVSYIRFYINSDPPSGDSNEFTSGTTDNVELLYFDQSEKSIIPKAEGSLKYIEFAPGALSNTNTLICAFMHNKDTNEYTPFFIEQVKSVTKLWYTFTGRIATDGFTNEENLNVKIGDIEVLLNSWGSKPSDKDNRMNIYNNLNKGNYLEPYEL